MVRPIREGLPAKRRCHKPQLTTTAPAAAGSSSEGEKSRPSAKSREKIPGAVDSAHLFRKLSTCSRQVGGFNVLQHGQVPEGAALLLPFGEDSRRNLVVRKLVIGTVLIQAQEPAGVLKRQGLEKHCVHDSKEGGGGTDSQGHYEDGRDREAWSSTERTRTVTQVARPCLEPGPAPGIAGFFLEHGSVAEGSLSRVTGFVGAHTSCNVLGNLVVEMKSNLIIQVAG